jgi:DNA-binding LytR/AlgR family response regulator
MLPFNDEKGIMRISVKSFDLLYLQAADNYVTIFYSQQQKTARYMLRSSLKQIETELAYSPLIRCHRSYMVNFEKVKIIRREKDGLILELESTEPIEIPVSKTYMEDVFRAFRHDL